MELAGVKNSLVSNLAGTLLCILFRLCPEQLCRLESLTRLPLLTRKNYAKSMFR